MATGDMTHAPLERRQNCQIEFSNIDTALQGVKRSMSALKGSMTLISRALNEQGREIVEINQKIHNGFDAKIIAVDEKVEKLEHRNEADHIKLMKETHYTRNLIFTLLILIVGGFATSIITQQVNHSYERGQLNGVTPIEQIIPVDTESQVP